MKNLEQYLAEKLKIAPLGELKSEPFEDTVGVFSGETVIIDGIDTGIVVAYIDYLTWLEQKIENSDDGMGIFCT